MFQLKLKLFKLIQEIFSFFNFRLYYSKDKNILKNIIFHDIIDVGVVTGTNFLLKKFPNANYYLIEANKNYYPDISPNFLNLPLPENKKKKN